ncbi:MAG: RDD family protein, partial [Thermoanaerobaculia bacterium]|nr:RDD family protein [Thermoanaerobaculia bacterium]
MPRFDEIELKGPDTRGPDSNTEDSSPYESAGIASRIIAFVIDLSLFVAAAIALSPVLPDTEGVILAWSAVIGFLILVSLYYLGLGWMVWGKTIGGAIADVRVVSDNLGDVNVSQAARRWGGT